jgi:hypothetical protein
MQFFIKKNNILKFLLSLGGFIILTYMCLNFYKLILENDPYRIFDSLYAAVPIIPFMYFLFYNTIYSLNINWDRTPTILTAIIPSYILYYSIILFNERLNHSQSLQI